MWWNNKYKKQLEDLEFKLKMLTIDYNSTNRRVIDLDRDVWKLQNPAIKVGTTVHLNDDLEIYVVTGFELKAWSWEYILYNERLKESKIIRACNFKITIIKEK